MSSANAAAIKRRVNSIPSSDYSQRRDVNAYNNSSSSPVDTNVPANSGGMTMQQVISVIDNRLVFLEKNISVKDDLADSQGTISDAMSVYIEDFNSRFELLAIEIDSIKTVVMNLQSYTMDVNRRLLDDKVIVAAESNDSKLFEMSAYTPMNSPELLP